MIFFCFVFEGREQAKEVDEGVGQGKAGRMRGTKRNDRYFLGGANMSKRGWMGWEGLDKGNLVV